MRFKIEPPIARAQARPEVQIGDVYPAKGGARKRIAMWVVLAKSNGGSMVHMMGLNDEGVAMSTTSYGVHTVETRDRIGFVRGLAELEFQIEAVKGGDAPPAPVERATALPVTVAAAVHAAVAAIYLHDSSDYRGALWTVVKELNPSMYELLMCDARAAYQRSAELAGETV